MSTLLSTQNLGHSVGTKRLFNDLNFSVAEGDQIGLVGHNGCGKSSLFRLLNGAEQADEGEINRRRGLRLTTVEQFLPAELAVLRVTDAVLERFAPDERQQRSFEAERLLEQLGFTAAEFDLAVGDLSGGQQNRLMFARAVIGEPQLILFDEPTNHLDLATLRMFEQFMRDTVQAAYILVSHDRTFLDSVTSRTLVLRDERIYSFDLAFSAAREALSTHDVANAQMRKAEEQRIKALETSAKRLANWGRTFDNEKFSRRAKSMAKRVERLESEKTFVTRGSGLKLEIDLEDLHSKRVMRIDDFDVKPTTTDAQAPTLFHIGELNIRPGERIALLGANGVGKSSLIREIVTRFREQSALDTHFDFSPQTSLGYYDQELEELHDQGAMIDFLRQHSDAGERAIRSGLIHAGFGYADHDRPIAGLSGGERARLLFVKLRLEAPNFLILDEPTNHIDIEGREQLERQLLESGSTLLITSHDRRFIDNIADRYLVIDKGGLAEHTAPDSFYQSLLSGELRRVRTTARDNSVVPAAERSQEALLERLVELERKLCEDLERKPKHQKPARQREWQDEIDSINKQL